MRAIRKGAVDAARVGGGVSPPGGLEGAGVLEGGPGASGGLGGEVSGTQGTPVEILGRLVHTSLFPDLWKVRTELTELARLDD